FDSIIVSNNQMGGINIGGTGGGISFRGIDYAGTTGNFIFENNIFGSRTTANSIVQNTPNSIFGIINRNSNETFNQQIKGNTFANITTNTGILAAIFALGGTAAVIENNQIFNLRSNSSNQTAYGTGIALTGIYFGSSSGNAKIVNKNTIYNLQTTTSTSIANASGIIHNNTGTANNIISKNSISAIYSNTSAKNNLIGIHHITGNVTIHNNEISLGTDSIGSGISNAHTFAGIIKETGNAAIIYNSVRIQGSNVSTSDTMPSMAFKRTSAGTDQIINNIFVNERSNSSTGGGLHLALDLNNVSTYTANRNMLYSSAFNSDFARVSGTIFGTLAAYQSATLIDSSSKSKLPSFIAFNSLELNSISLGDLDFIATPLANYPSDIRDTLRNMATPYIGCYEDLSMPLPVGLNQFTIQNIEGNVLLNWNTSWEQNNKGFMIERSTNKLLFESVGFVSGIGNSHSINKYQFIDKNAFEMAQTNQLYYRLKQIDFDGKYSYSNVLTIGNQNLFNNEVTVFPNPFINAIHIAFNAENATNVTVNIVDMHGKLVFQENRTIQNGISELLFEPNQSLASGVYLMQLNIDGKSKILKLIKE
ncbi:MAG: T9SS type A sorting domain-containing protein, partial [Bacteroidota bacterium]|nr:T9SS type A sorting domain-containing protein [Bacteroidota bacterium]